MIKMISKYINCFLNKIFYKEEEIDFSEAIKIECKYYIIPSIMDMKKYRKPHIGQKFLCQYESEMYVYVGGGKYMCIANAYI